MINVFQPCLGYQELEAVRDVFESNWLGVGSKVRLFADRFAKYLGSAGEEFVPVTSCTEGLFQTMAALELGPGDQVVLPTISFVGAAHAVRATGAEVVLCDVDPCTLNPGEENVSDCITNRTKAIVILHYGGHPGRLSQIAGVAHGRNITLVEDSACGLGSTIQGKHAGTFGDFGVWSFDAMKVLVTGDGGMVRASQVHVRQRIRSSSYFGLRESGKERAARTGRWWEIDPEVVGRLGLMNDLTAAIGIVQLERLPTFLERRKEISRLYNQELSSLEWVKTPCLPEEGSDSSWYFYWIQTTAGLRDQLAEFLLTKDIYTTFRYWPLHRTQMYADNPEKFPGAEKACMNTLLLPIHQALVDSDVAKIVEALHDFQPRYGLMS